jgi:Carboxypeptidase regulatory-like domain/TonB dependent receptor
MTIRKLVLLSALLCAPMFGQSPTGALEGVVSDSTGAVIPDAKVTVTNTATNSSKVLSTDRSGRFQVPLLPPGTYSVQVSAPGFKQGRQDNINVEVSENHPVDFALSPGGANQTVEVSTTANLEIDTSSTGAVITEKRIVDLPLNGRNPFDFAGLAPGVNITGNSNGASTPHISGSRNANNEQLLDGQTNILPENNVGNSSSAYTPIVDSVQEFNVQTSVLPAEYGRFSGGVISLITKSGTNQLHGTGFIFARNSVFDARNYYNNGDVPPVSRYQEGGTLGGPLVIPHVYNGHNRTFFFVAYEKSNLTHGDTANFLVPTEAERAGDFSASGSTIYDPNTVTSSIDPKTGATVFNRTPFSYQGRQNVIDPARFSKVAISSLAYYPKPNVAGNGYNFTSTGTDTDSYYHFDTKIDHNWTPNWHTFVRFSHYADFNVPFSDFNNVASEGYGGPTTSGSYSLSYDNTFTFSPTLLGEIRYGLSRSSSVRLPFGGSFPLTSLGFPQNLADVANVQVFPNYNFGNGFSSLGSSGYVALLENPLAHDVNASIIKITHGNSLKFGGEFRKLFLNFHQYAQPSGSYTFGQSWTQAQLNNNQGSSDGNSFADFLLGLPENGYITHDITTAQASSYFALYAQDDYKVNSRLTLNAGLRWDVERPRTERHNQFSYWDINAQSPIQGAVSATGVSAALCPACSNLRGALNFVDQPGSPYGRRQAPTQWKGFAPRVGASFSANEKTVIRAGFGIVYAPSSLQAAGTTGDAGTQGFAGQTNFSFTHDQEQTINTTLDNPAKDGFSLPQGVTGGPGTYLGNAIGDSFFSSVRNPYSIQTNFNVQRSLPLNTVLEVGYVGNRGLFLPDGDPGTPYDQLTTNYLTLGDHLFDQVANPFYGIITTAGSNLSNPTVSRNQLLRPFPQYSNVSSVRKPDKQSNYQALTVKVDKRFSQGLTVLIAFTGSKTLDTASAAVNYLGPQSATFANQYNPNGEYAVSAYDVSRQLVSSFSYELPFGRGRHFLSGLNGIGNVLLSGFQVDGIVNWNTGTPVVLGALSSDKTGLLGGGQRPNQVLRSAKLSHQTNSEWFNTAAFALPDQFVIGNAPRTLPNVRNPGFTNADLSIFKNTYIGGKEHYNLQLRLEAFNALNHPYFAAPDATFTDGSNFGKVTGTNGDPRDVQLAAKFIF